MKAGDADRLRAWLADPSVADVDPLTVGRLRARLAAEADAEPSIAVEPHGTFVARAPSPRDGVLRRVLELDRLGTLLSVLRWDEDGRLARAWIRIADGSWVMIEPRATRHPSWGLCDRLWHAPHPAAPAPVALTVFEALAYEHIERIPTLAEPARLPPGAGTAVLNVVAALAADAGRARLVYTGPYPTEQLFLALLGSFRYCTAEVDPLAAFMAGRVEWSPAPHERVFLPSGVVVRLRGRVEEVVWRGRVYRRPDWQQVERHAPRRVRDVGGAVVCSLWALGGAVEDHLRLDPGGTTVSVIAPSPPGPPALQPLPAPVLAGVASAAAALGAPPLAPFVRAAAAGCQLAWAELEADLVAVDAAHLRVSHAFREMLSRRLRAAATRDERVAVGLAALIELVQLLGDPLRAQAQTRAAALPPDAQARLLTEAGPAEEGADDARRIVEAIEALIVEATS